jgi:dTMP kinase
VVLTREPGGTTLGDDVRQILLRPDYEMAPETELFLLQASRRELCRLVIRPALERGEIVLVDRFGDSSVAYQGYGRGLGPDRVREVVSMATNGLVPDMTLLLDVDTETGLRRARGLKKRERLGQDHDRMEGESVEFFRRVRQGYLRMAEEEERFRVISVTESPEKTFIDVKRTLRSVLAAGIQDQEGKEESR